MNYLACLTTGMIAELRKAGALPAYYTSIVEAKCSVCDCGIGVGPKLEKIHKTAGYPYACMMCATRLNVNAGVQTADEWQGH